MANIIVKQNKKKNFYRGDIYYVEKSPSYCVGSETYGARPAVIVSNNANNIHSDVVEVVYLTTSPKADLPTHVKISSTARKSIAMCEQIWSVSKSRLGDYYGTITPSEQEEMDKALLISLALEGKEEKKSEPSPVGVVKDYAEIKMERDMYKKMYDDLMNRIMTK